MLECWRLRTYKVVGSEPHLEARLFVGLCPPPPRQPTTQHPSRSGKLRTTLDPHKPNHYPQAPTPGNPRGFPGNTMAPQIPHGRPTGHPVPRAPRKPPLTLAEAAAAATSKTASYSETNLYHYSPDQTGAAACDHTRTREQDPSTAPAQDDDMTDDANDPPHPTASHTQHTSSPV